MPDLPSTPAAAPPNFYSQVGKLGAGAGTSAGTGGKGAAAPMDADHEFLDSVNKLLNVLAKLGQMQPRGQDITKFTQAAADAMKQCVEQVFGGDPGSDPAGSDSGSSSADTGTAAGGAVSPQMAM